MKLTRRSALTGLGAVALSAPFVRPSWAAAGSVNIYNWSDYIGESTISDFEAASGISVVYDLYASAEEMQAKMLAGSTGYDVVIMAGLTLPQFIKANIYQKLDKTKLKNWANLDPAILKIVEGFDPGNQFGEPYMWGSVGMTYNMDMIKQRLPGVDLNSLDAIMKPENAAKLADCGISLLDSPTDIGFMVMSWLGINPSTATQADYDKMVAAFKPIRQYINTFDNSNYLTTLPNKELCVANTWSGDYGVAKSRAKDAGVELDLEYFVPKTGAPAWFDLWCIPADAKNVDSAYAFLDYMLQPDVIAKCTDFTGYANANKAATALVDPAVSGDPAIYPDAETLTRMYTPLPQTEEQDRMLTRAWTEIKAG
ncbi:MAG: polyamine ABC transporter substrate-binding protein [Paracoccaceae bacterium]